MNAPHLGFYNTSSTRTHVGFQFSTHAAAGANVAPNSAFEAADLRIYRAADGAAFSATQRSSSNGITMTSPFDSLTGVHDVDIDLTDNTDSGFYASGYRYCVMLCPDETVDSQTLTGVVLAYFEIGVAKADVTHMGGTTQTARDIGASVLLSSGTGTGQVKLSSGYVAPNWGDVGNPTTTVGLTNTTVKTATDVEDDTQDIQNRVPAALTANGNIKSSFVELITTVLTESATGRLKAALTTFLNVATPVFTAECANQLQDHTAALADIDTALSKVPKSDGTTGWNATARAQIQTEVEEGVAVRLNTAVPGSPTSGSINERIKTMDDADLPTLIGAVPTGVENAAALMDLTDGIESGITPKQAIRVLLAILSGRIATAGEATEIFLNPSGGATRVTIVVDEDGNRSSVTINA